MVLDSRRVLDRLADAITDETPIDWSTERSTDPEVIPSLENLRLIERIAEVYRNPWAIATPPAEPMLFEWGRLRIQQVLGEGGYGTVYRAHDPLLQRDVALKLLRGDREGRALDRQRFVEEARRMARVRHPNVLVIHGAEEHDGRVGFWSDLVDGETLEARLRRDGPLGAGEAALVGVEICRALAAVHQADVVHGDVKPSNVMRDRGGRIVLTDFGAASESGGEAPSGTVMGTPLTLAPEQIDGAPASASTDLYALGVMIFRLVTGRYPVESGDLSGLRTKHRLGERTALLDLRPDLPAEFTRVVERALAPDPAGRYRTAGEMERDLSAIAMRPQATVPSQTEVPAVASDRPARRRMLPVLLACIPLVAILIIGFWTRSRETVAGNDGTGDRPASVSQAAPSLDSALPGKHTSPAALPSTDQNADAVQPGIAGSVAGASTNLAKETTPVAALAVEATLYRSLGGAREALSAGSLVHPGDAIFLEIEGNTPLSLYVLNEDQEGRVYLLFPLPGLDLQNPLRGSTRHRIPGTRGGVAQDWQVTNGRGDENFLIVASRNPLEVMESAIRNLPRAEPGRPVEPTPIDPRAVLDRRGIGGMVASGAPAAAPTGKTVSEIARRLAENAEPGGLWVREIAVYNLGR
jgi:serine/threonine protein kinase